MFLLRSLEFIFRALVALFFKFVLGDEETARAIADQVYAEARQLDAEFREKHRLNRERVEHQLAELKAMRDGASPAERWIIDWIVSRSEAMLAKDKNQ